MVDNRTGHSYMVLNTSVFSHSIHKFECAKHGAILPEPKNEEENNFLASLNTSMFFLGLVRHGEKEWRWESDNTTVGWTLWLSALGEPDGGAAQSCTLMLRSLFDDQAGHRPEGWASMQCLTPLYDGYPKNIVCQKKGSLLVFIVSRII